MEVSENLELHDSEIVKISVDRRTQNGKIDFLLENGQLGSISFIGLKAFRCEDFTLQNVINRVLRSSRNEITRENVDYWFQWVTSLSDSSSWLSENRKKEWISSCDLGKLDLIIIEPSAGAQIVVLCERSEISFLEK